MSKLTHLDNEGNARMVDVGGKPITRRIAIASGRVSMQPATAASIREGVTKKGDVLAVARVAGIQAAKRAWELIPLAHPIPLDHVSIDLEVLDDAVLIRAIPAPRRTLWGWFRTVLRPMKLQQESGPANISGPLCVGQ